MSSQILIWKDKCQKWDDIVICQPLMISPDHNLYFRGKGVFLVKLAPKRGFWAPLERLNFQKSLKHVTKGMLWCIKSVDKF